MSIKYSKMSLKKRIYCGIVIKDKERIWQQNQEITNDTNQQSNDELNMFENYDPKNSIFSKIGRSIGNHIKIFGIALVALIIVLIGVNIFKTLYDGTKLNWVKNEGYEISAVTPSGIVILSRLVHFERR